MLPWDQGELVGIQYVIGVMIYTLYMFYVSYLLNLCVLEINLI